MYWRQNYCFDSPKRQTTKRSEEYEQASGAVRIVTYVSSRENAMAIRGDVRQDNQKLRATYKNFQIIQLKFALTTFRYSWYNHYKAKIVHVKIGHIKIDA